jgi:hypothetical protein
MIRTNIVVATLMGVLVAVSSAFAQVNDEQIVTQKDPTNIAKGWGRRGCGRRPDGW